MLSFLRPALGRPMANVRTAARPFLAGVHLRQQLQPPPPAAMLAAVQTRSAGHNKWSKIRHKKGDSDQKRALVFSRLGREIMAAIKASNGNADPSTNATLATLLSKARAANMPSATIGTAIAKATGAAGTTTTALTTATYGGTVHGVAILVEVLTDNTNRAVQSVRKAFTKANGSFGAVAYLFVRRGAVTVAPPERAEGDGAVSPAQENAFFEAVMDAAADAGAEDVVRAIDAPLDDPMAAPTGSYTALTPVADAASVSAALSSHGFDVVGVELVYSVVSDDYLVDWPEQQPEKVKDLTRALETLEDCEDVLRVHTNLRD